MNGHSHPVTDELILKHCAEQSALKDTPVSFDRLLELTLKQYTEMAEHARAIEQSGPEDSGWIECKVRMPECGGSIFCAGLDPDGEYWREIVNGRWLRENPKFATHWMPLPAAPCATPEREG